MLSHKKQEISVSDTVTHRGEILSEARSTDCNVFVVTDVHSSNELSIQHIVRPEFTAIVPVGDCRLYRPAPFYVGQTVHCPTAPTTIDKPVRQVRPTRFTVEEIVYDFTENSEVVFGIKISLDGIMLDEIFSKNQLEFPSW